MTYLIKNDLYLANYPRNDIISSKKAFLANLARRRGQEEKKRKMKGRKRKKEKTDRAARMGRRILQFIS